MRYILLFFVFPVFCFGQSSALELAENVFAMSIKNDETAFISVVPDVAAVNFLVKEYGGGATMSDEAVKAEQEKNLSRALKGFRMLQESVQELEIDLSKAVITKKEVAENENRWKRDGKEVNITMKEVTIFFTCNEKKLAFRIADAMEINGRWYIGYEYVAIYWLD